MAKIGCRPESPLGVGRLICNIWVHGHTQFDGVLLPNSFEGEFDSGEFLSGNYSYDLVEIKTVQRARETSGSKKSLRLRRGHLIEMQKKLGKAAVGQVKEKDSIFRFPNSLFFCYLRGSLSNSVYRIPINRSFIEDWAMGLKEKRQQMPLIPEEDYEVDLLLQVLEINKERLRLEEDKRGKRLAAVMEELEKIREAGGFKATQEELSK